MKTSVPNQIINQQNNVLLFQNPLIFTMKRLLLLMVLFFLTGTITAQESRVGEPSTQVMEVKTYLSSLRASERNSRNGFSNADNIESLLYKVQPSVYYYSGTVKTYGAKPRDLFTDFQSLSGLNNPTIQKNNIELVTIRINNASELSATIDFSVFSDYKNLKYVYIISNADTTSQNITRMVGSYSEKYSVFYKIDKGDKNQ